MSDIPSYAPTPLTDRLLNALASLGIKLPVTGAGPPSRFSPHSLDSVGSTAGRNAPGADAFSSLLSTPNPIPPSRPDMTLGDPGFAAVTSIIQMLEDASRSSTSTRPPPSPKSARTRGTTSIPIPVPSGSRIGGKGGSPDVSSPPAPYNIAQTVLPPAASRIVGAGGSPGVNPALAGGGAATGPGTTNPTLTPQEIEDFLFSMSPIGAVKSAPPVGGAPMPPAAAQPSVPMGTGPNQGGGAAVASAGSAGGPAGPTVGTPPAPPMASPMAMPSPQPQGQGTLGPQFLQGMSPQMIQALLGLMGRGGR
jgi:hypothetical protein